MSIGLGDAMSGSWRQKLNIGSSTEAELVGIDDDIKSIMWGVYFIQAQGYEVTNNIRMKNNKSTILLANNCRFYSSKRTNHIKNRYFMIKDKIGKGETVIQYCPTGDMWANINTKALQGILFYKIHGRLMGIGEDYDDDIEKFNNHPDLLTSQECADHVSAENTSVLVKVEDIVKVLEVSQNALPNATNKTQADVAAFLFTITMAQQTRESSSRCRSVLGYKGKPLHTGDKDTHTN